MSQFLNNSPALPLFNSLVFSNYRYNLAALFVDNSQALLNNEPLLKSGNYSLASNKLQCIRQTIFTLVIEPFSSIASIECTDSSVLTSKNTFCTTFKLCGSSRWGLISTNGSDFLSQVKSNLFKYQSSM